MKSVVIFFCLSVLLFPQTYKLSGRVIDAKTGEVLPYTNIRDTGGKGTAANAEGKFTLQLTAGSYRLTASFIGYIADTVLVSVPISDNKEIIFRLQPVSVELPEVTVLPGENPALEVIRKAILKKEQLRRELHSYQMQAYTKTVVKTPGNIGGSGGGVTLSIGAADSAELNIGAIFENQSTGYFRKPDDFKEVITARKQTANLPPYVNTLTGGRFIQNFYSDDLNFFGKPLTAPLASDALSYYYYYITDTLLLNSTPVFEISMTPDDDADPGFRGKIYIADQTFHLLKVDLELNRAANPGGLFDSVRIYQQFEVYDGFPLPADYRIFARISFIGLVKIGLELATLLSEYSVNQPISDEIFSGAVITVIPEADTRDSLYWSTVQVMPVTGEEDSAYIRIDSLNNVTRSFWEQYSIIGPESRIYEYYSVPGLLGIYHFNRVEGHTFSLDFRMSGMMDRRLRTELEFAYGLSDKKAKQKFTAEYSAGTYREIRIGLSAKNEIEYLLPEAAYKSPFQTTMVSLLSRYDPDDYFYRRGGELNLSADIFRYITFSAGYGYQDDRSAVNRTAYAISGKGKQYRQNMQIADVTYHTLSAGIGLDLRDYIEDGYYRRRLGRSSDFPLIDIYADYLAGGTYDRASFGYGAKIRGTLPVSLGTELRYRLHGFYANGPVPFQRLHAAAGNMDWSARENTFRTLGIYPAAGDRGYTAFLNYDTGDALFRASGIPFLNKAELQLAIFLNSGLFVQNAETKLFNGGNLLPELIKPLYEAGFSLGHAIVPLTFEFAWKLNYRGDKNFRISIVSLSNF